MLIMYCHMEFIAFSIVTRESFGTCEGQNSPPSPPANPQLPQSPRNFVPQGVWQGPHLKGTWRRQADHQCFPHSIPLRNPAPHWAFTELVHTSELCCSVAWKPAFTSMEVWEQKLHRLTYPLLFRCKQSGRVRLMETESHPSFGWGVLVFSLDYQVLEHGNHTFPLLFLLNFMLYFLTTVISLSFHIHGLIQTWRLCNATKDKVFEDNFNCLSFKLNSTCSANNVHHVIDEETVWRAVTCVFCKAKDTTSLLPPMSGCKM